MPERNFTVTTFTPNVDNPGEIAAIHLSIRRWQEDIGQNTFKNILESQKDLKVLDRYYVARGGNFFIAKDWHGRIIGFIGLRSDGGGIGVFKRLAVVPDWHRRGVAKSLITLALDWARQNGFEKIKLQTNIGEHAKPLYDRFGFETVGWVDDQEDWLMELKL